MGCVNFDIDGAEGLRVLVSSLPRIGFPSELGLGD